MSEQQTNLEVIAPTVEEAVEKGLAELSLTNDEVEIEILDPGSRGLFGLGSRQARIRLTLRGAKLKSEEFSPKPDRNEQLAYEEDEVRIKPKRPDNSARIGI